VTLGVGIAAAGMAGVFRKEGQGSALDPLRP
jgi:hypothetical protein